MNIEIQLNRDFERCLEDLKNKYGEDFEFINGVHASQLDYSSFLKMFAASDTVADATIDPNANAKHRDIRSFMTEKGKSEDKLFALNKIFLEIKKKWGLRSAKQWLECEFNKSFYLNDSATASFFAYCWAQDLSRMAREGLFFLGEGYNNQPPKHLTTYLDDVIEFVSFLSNRQSGAVGLPNVIIWAWWFWKRDVDNNYLGCSNYGEAYLKQNFQKLIYRLNQPFLRIDQSAFTNVSFFDREYLMALFGGLEFPDGTFAIDNIEDIMRAQRLFMEVIAEVRTESMFTFPVLTISLLYKDGHFVDEETARWASRHNMKWYDSNFFISDNVGVLSNCPLKGDTKILYWSEYYQTFKINSIKQVYENLMRKEPEDRILTVLSSGKRINCRVNKFNESADYRIELVNGAVLYTTANHLNKVYGKDYVKTCDLTEQDYLPVSLCAYESSDNMTYEAGKLVGMFLGDGSYANKAGITYSLNPETDAEDIEFIKQYCAKYYGAKFNEYACTSSISGKASCINLTCNSRSLRGLIEQFVEGDDALSKSINLSALNCSKEFRHGIIDGLYATDGSKSTGGGSNRIYTSSEKLKDTLVILCASLGIATTVSTDTREGRLSTNPCYIIRYYTPNGRTQHKDVYIIEDNYFWFKIKSITRSNPTEVSYCLEVVDTDVPEEFMLGNGIVTHNCRLLSETTKLSGFVNSIGGTALSIGSCRVSTINLMRIAYESKFNKAKYLSILRDRVTLNCKALYSMRHILKRNIEKGLLPNYQDGAVELEKQYCTIGILGMYEVMDSFGLVDTDELGYRSYSDAAIKFASEIFEVIDDVKDNFDCDFTFNVEQIPGENCAGVLCTADNLLYEQNKYFIYSNQWIPLYEKCTIQEKCRISSILDAKCGGGAIAHIDVENRFPTEEAAWKMLNYLAEHKVIYSAFTTKINTCKNQHAFVGTKTCPQCGEPIAEQWGRVVGFYVPRSAMQKIRRKEFDQRKWYRVLENDMVV